MNRSLVIPHVIWLNPKKRIYINDVLASDIEQVIEFHGFHDVTFIVSLVRANKSIEDWFLFDMEGLRSFLRISPKTKLPVYKGQKGLEQLFLKVNKTYIKGVRCKGLVDALDMDKNFPHICGEIRSICNTMGVDCSTANERCK